MEIKKDHTLQKIHAQRQQECEVYSQQKIKTPKQRQCHRSGGFTVNFELILDLILVPLWLTLLETRVIDLYVN